MAAIRECKKFPATGWYSTLLPDFAPSIGPTDRGYPLSAGSSIVPSAANSYWATWTAQPTFCYQRSANCPPLDEPKWREMGAWMSNSEPEKLLLDNVDPEKRQFIGKLIGTGAFVAPLVASFSMANIAAANPPLFSNAK